MWQNMWQIIGQGGGLVKTFASLINQTVCQATFLFDSNLLVFYPPIPMTHILLVTTMTL